MDQDSDVGQKLRPTVGLTLAPRADPPGDAGLGWVDTRILLDPGCRAIDTQQAAGHLLQKDASAIHQINSCLRRLAGHLRR